MLKEKASQALATTRFSRLCSAFLLILPRKALCINRIEV